MHPPQPWWQWRHDKGPDTSGFAVIGVGRFGSSVIDELVRAGADVLAIDCDQRAIDALKVLTNSPYRAALQALAEQLLDRRS